MFIGRSKEISVLNEKYLSGKSELAVIYGRRRIGKSRLISEFAKGKPEYLHFEALEGEKKPKQIRHFKAQLGRQKKDGFLDNMEFPSWERCFDYLTEKHISPKGRKAKLVLFFDEIQWMACGRSALISLIKYYWDNHWKNRNVMLILCGSIASFMVKKVIASKALYGRINLEVLLKGLEPQEAKKMFRNKRSNEEVLKYLLVFGTVPKYLEEINLSQSFNQNINRLCFSPEGSLFNEVERIFYSQFREAQTYRRIVELLGTRIYTAVDISRKLKMPNSGGLRSYLTHLENAEIIRSYIPFSRSESTKFKKYRLSDEYLSLYFKFIKPYAQTIRKEGAGRKFEAITASGFQSWLGFAFERFCLKYSRRIAEIIGFSDDVLKAAPCFERGDTGFQVDLLYQRADKVLTLCEIKYYQDPVGTKIIPEIEEKIKSLKVPRGHTLEKALISLNGPDTALKDAGFFHHYVTMKDLLG